MSAGIPPLLRFSPDELNQAHEKWGCNCGPAALAACCGLTLDEIRGALVRFGKTGYVNREMMYEAIVKLDFRAKVDLVADQDGVDRYPSHGLCLIQFGGPWFTSQNASKKWQLLHTHWIACKIVNTQTWIFDVNCFGWESYLTWSERTLPRLIAADKYRDGTHHLLTSWEVRRIVRTRRGSHASQRRQS